MEILAEQTFILLTERFPVMPSPAFNLHNAHFTLLGKNVEEGKRQAIFSTSTGHYLKSVMVFSKTFII